MVVGAANVSIVFFSCNMLENIKLNIDITNNHAALTSNFPSPCFKKTVLLEISDFLGNADNVSIVTIVYASIVCALQTSVN